MFTTMAHEDKDEDFRLLHEACVDKYGHGSKLWAIENKRLKVHCQLVVEVERHANWIKKMEEQIMLSQMGKIVDKIKTQDTDIYIIKMDEDEKIVTHEDNGYTDFHIGDDVIYKDGRMFKLIKGGSNNIAA